MPFNQSGFGIRMNNNAQVALQGYAPVCQRLSEFQFGEQVGQSGGTAFNKAIDTGIDLSVQATLPRRKIYCWLYVYSTSTSYLVNGNVVFYLNKSMVGKLPIANMGTTYPASNSFPMVFQSGGDNVQDCINLFISNNVNGQPDSISLQPLYIFGQFDEAKVILDKVINVNDMRIFLGILSST
jgi:hypothetical protein